MLIRIARYAGSMIANHISSPRGEKTKVSDSLNIISPSMELKIRLTGL